MEDNLKGESNEVRACIMEYFTEEEWNAIPDALKKRHLNMTRNYVDVPCGAMFFPKPEFMTENMKRKETCPVISKSTIQDIISSFKVSKAKRTDVEPERRNPKRNVPERNYLEEEEPASDRYIFCDVCQVEYLDFCWKCGMLLTLEDNPVPLGTEDRAKKTAPKGVLEVRPSQIHGCGVFALRSLKSGIRLGPYEGQVTRMDTKNGYAWKLRDGRLIDASDETNSNYLRYVNCARTASEQNLVAFQYRGGLYYRTCKNIDEGEELLVFYGDSFAKNLGIDTKRYFEPTLEDRQTDFYVCKFCHIGLSTVEYLDCHQKRCRFDPRKMALHTGPLYKCKHCQCSLISLDFLEKHQVICRRVLQKQQQQGAGANKEQSDRKPKKVQEKEHSKVYKCEKSNSGFHAKFRQFKFKCEHCQKEFVRKQQLDGHTLSHHSNSTTKITSKIHYCDLCDYKTVSKTCLTRHKYKHFKENAPKFKCSKCKYFSYYKSHLKKHLLTHSNIFPYFCVECKKGFNQKSNLDSHILSNHKDSENLLKSISHKINYCDLCDYKTLLKTNLTSHKYKHSKEKAPKYNCSKCQYFSNQKGNLKRHLLTHSNIFPYICIECQNKVFNQKSQLDAHILSNHKDNKNLLKSISSKIHNCNICQYQTTRQSELKKHTKTHSKMTFE